MKKILVILCMLTTLSVFAREYKVKIWVKNFSDLPKFKGNVNRIPRIEAFTKLGKESRGSDTIAESVYITKLIQDGDFRIKLLPLRRPFFFSYENIPLESQKSAMYGYKMKPKSKSLLFNKMVELINEYHDRFKKELESKKNFAKFFEETITINK